jgi:ribonucleoside-diphosphate reductase beta chain
VATTERRTAYKTVTGRGLDWSSVPMRLFQKAKRLGTWDPLAIALERDKQDWSALPEMRREDLIGTTTLFCAGEEAVTLDLLPLVMTVAERGMIEEEIYLTSFLWEEAKHTEFFTRWLTEVPRLAGHDLHEYMGPNYRRLFFDELPGAMNRLMTDRSDEALARALVTYNMIIEGTLAETGYESYRRQLESGRLLPGLSSALRLISRDEARHIRFGVYMLQLLISNEGRLWDVVDRRMNELLPFVIGMITPPMDGPAPTPDEQAYSDEMQAFAVRQFERRMNVLRRARKQTREEIRQEAAADLDAEPDPI